MWSFDKSLQNIQYQKTNKYMFHGTVPFHFRAHKEDWLQFTFVGDQMNVIDSLDYITPQIFVNFPIEDHFLRHPHDSPHKKIVPILSSSVFKYMFCNFIHACPYRVTKYAYDKFECMNLKSYEYKHEKLSSRAFTQVIKNSLFVPILTTNDDILEIGPELFEAAYHKKIILTNDVFLKHTFNYSNVILEENITNMCARYTEVKDLIVDDTFAQKIANFTFSHFIFDLLTQGFDLSTILQIPKYSFRT
jgi:hypothetical protein